MPAEADGEPARVRLAERPGRRLRRDRRAAVEPRDARGDDEPGGRRQDQGRLRERVPAGVFAEPERVEAQFLHFRGRFADHSDRGAVEEAPDPDAHRDTPGTSTVDSRVIDA